MTLYENTVGFGTSGSILATALKIVTAAGTRVQLVSAPCMEVIITAQAFNTGYIYVGNSNVSALMYIQRLSAGEGMVLSVTNSSQIWIDSSVSLEGALYTIIG